MTPEEIAKWEKEFQAYLHQISADTNSSSPLFQALNAVQGDKSVNPEEFAIEKGTILNTLMGGTSLMNYVAAKVVSGGEIDEATTAVIEEADKGFAAIGFGFGMYDDMANGHMSFGQALSHNMASASVTFLTGTVVTTVGEAAAEGTFGTVMAGTALASNPVGWAIGASIVVGLAFEWGYQNNIGGLRTELNKTGGNPAPFNPFPNNAGVGTGTDIN